MAHTSADALILRSVAYGENDRLLTVLTADEGRFTAIVKGGASMHRREVAATQPFTLVNLELYEKNGMKWVKSATVLRAFEGLQRDLDRLFLAAYVADVTYELTNEKMEAGEILPLALNTLFALSQEKSEIERIKAAFEMRAACIAGFLPMLDSCAHCKKGEKGDTYLDVMNGALVCRDCFLRAQNALPVPSAEDPSLRRLLLPLDGSALVALRYVCTAEPRRVFAFRLATRESLHAFGVAAENYLLHHLERGFDSLENYKKMASFTASK